MWVDASDYNKMKLSTTQAPPGKTVTTQHRLELEILDPTKAHLFFRMGGLLLTLNAGHGGASELVNANRTNLNFENLRCIAVNFSVRSLVKKNMIEYCNFVEYVAALDESRWLKKNNGMEWWRWQAGPIRWCMGYSCDDILQMAKRWRVAGCIPTQSSPAAIHGARNALLHHCVQDQNFFKEICQML